MLANERRNQIYQIIQNDGAVMVSRLVERFGVSLETVRRDLLVMEQKGLLTRVHGGAVTKNDMKQFLCLPERNKEHSEKKNELASKAVKFISEGDVIGIDSGSTAIHFAEALKDKFTKLTVVTHCMDVFERLANYKEFSVILCGGQYMRTENTFYGELTLNMLDLLHVSKAFIFPAALSLKFGLCDHRTELPQIQKKLIDIADEVYILADSSKFEKTGLLKTSDMKPEYKYITDSDLKSELVTLYKENNIKIY